MPILEQSSLSTQEVAEEGIVCAIASHWRETDTLGLPTNQVHIITFEQWLALYTLGALESDAELQDIAAGHMEMAAKCPTHKHLAAQARAHITGR